MEKDQIPSIKITVDKKAMKAVVATAKTFKKVERLLKSNGELLAEILEGTLKGV